MNSTEENYEKKLNSLLPNLNLKEDEKLLKNSINIKIKNNTKKNMISKQYDSLNYSLEMHKVRKNKKADFDIYSKNEYNIEDEDIDKCKIVESWKDLSDINKNYCINNYVDILYDKYNKNLNKSYIYNFIIDNKNKIKYDKINKSIIDIQGIGFSGHNNEYKLYIKKKNNVNKNTQIDKLRKSLKKKT